MEPGVIIYTCLILLYATVTIRCDHISLTYFFYFCGIFFCQNFLNFFVRIEVDVWEEKSRRPTENEIAERSKGADGIFLVFNRVTKKILDAAGKCFSFNHIN